MSGRGRSHICSLFLRLNRCPWNAFPQLSPRPAEVNSRLFNFSKTRFDHLHRDHIVTEGLLPQRPANAPALCVFCARQLLVGPQDALRPNQAKFLAFLSSKGQQCIQPCPWSLMLSWYLAAFNHPKPKHTLSHVLLRFRREKPKALASKWHASGPLTDVMMACA